jgi:hypothetical protein
MRISRVVRSLLLPFAVLLAAAPAVFSAAPAGKVLRYQNSPGDAAVYDCKLSSRAESKSDDGKKLRAEISLQMRCTAEYLGDTASGVFGIRGTIESGTLKVKVDGTQQQTELPEYTEKFIVGNRGEMKSQSVVSGDPPVLMYGGLLLAVGPDEPLLLGGTAIFPDKPLQKGDKWKGTAHVPLPYGGKYNDWEYQSVLLGEETWRGRNCHRIKTTTSGAISEDVDAPDGSGILRGSGKITSVDTWLFDSERGLIVYSERSTRLATTAKLIVDGEVVRKQTTSGVLNEKNVLTEYNGVSVGAK